MEPSEYCSVGLQMAGAAPCVVLRLAKGMPGHEANI